MGVFFRAVACPGYRVARTRTRSSSWPLARIKTSIPSASFDTALRPRYRWDIRNGYARGEAMSIVQTTLFKSNNETGFQRVPGLMRENWA